MMKRFFGMMPISAGAACLALSACMTPTEPTQVAFMTQQELQDTLPGATVTGISSQDNKTEFSSTFSAGGTSGTTAGTWDGRPYDATWSIEGNKWCEQWDGGSACWLMRREGPNQIRAYKSETDPLRNPMTIQ